MVLSAADEEAQLRAAGWTPSPGDSVQAAWARTATPADQGIAQSAGYSPQQFGAAITQATAPFAQATSGVTAADLAERKRQFDLQLEWTKQMWAQQGLPQLQIQQQAAVLAQQEFEQQKQIAAQNYQLAQGQQAQSLAGLTGYYNAPPKLPTPADFAGLSPAEQAPYLQYHGAGAAADWARDAGAAQSAYAAAHPTQGIQTLAGQQQQFSQGMQQAGMGLNYLQAAAQLGGPADYFQSAAFNRGAQQTGQLPTFLTALRKNTGMPVFNEPGAPAAAPGVQSMGTLANGLTGGGSAGAAPGLAAIGAIGAQGGQALAPQAWENMNPDEQALFASGLKASGYSLPSFLQQYSQSRIGQRSGLAA